MKAQEFKEKADLVNKSLLGDYEDILDKIESAANRGEYSVRIGFIKIDSRLKLEQNGFKVSEQFYDPRDPSDSYATISWKLK